MLTIIALLIALAIGFVWGAENPSALADAKADLALAQAEGVRLSTEVAKRIHDINPDTGA